MWNVKILDVSKPLYVAILEAMERDIRSGVLKPGERMPTHRDLAEMQGVTLSTATRVYREAERRGLVSALVGNGTFVSADAGKKDASFIDFGLGLTDWDMSIVRPLPLVDPDIWPLVRKVLHKSNRQALMGYADPRGLAEHVAAGADWVSRFGLSVPPQNIVITAGAQHALFVICNSLFTPGDRIAADCLTYPGLKSAAQRNGLRLEGIPMDSAGMSPFALDSLCKRIAIKGIYLSGRVQIPTNREMPHSRRLELIEVIAKHGLMLIENDPYGFLSDAKDKTLSALIPDNSVYISSLSKVFFAGLRIAFVVAPPSLANKLSQGVADSMFVASPLCAGLAAECITSGLAEKAIGQKRLAILKRVSLFRKIFAGHFFESSDQSMVVWLTLPPHWKVRDIVKEAMKRKMRLFGADKFTVGGVPPPEAIRISLTGVESLVILKKALSALERLVSRAN